MEKKCGGKRRTNPQEGANIISYFTFFYSRDIFKRSRKKDLDEDDVYKPVQSFESNKLGDQIEYKLENLKSSGHDVSMYKLLRVCYGKEYVLFGLLQLMMRIATILLTPNAMGKLTNYFSEHPTEKVTRPDAYYYAAILLGMNLANVLYGHNYIFQMVQLGMRIRIAFCSLIYRKCLKISPVAMSKFTTGKIVNFLTKDMLAVDYLVLFANDLWIGVIQTIIVTYMLYARIGVASLAGVGFLVITIPTQILLGKATSTTRIKSAKKTDARLQITQEILTAIKLLKMYTWGKIFNKKVSDLRREEITKLRHVFYLKAIALNIGVMTSQIAFYLLVMSHIWLGNSITPEMVFFTMQCFLTLRSTIVNIIPLGIVQLAELHASEKRLRQFLNSEEIHRDSPMWGPIVEPKIDLKGVNVSIGNDKILTNINLSLEKGLTILSGPTGDGKSSLLKTILKDYPVTSGKVLTQGRVSYASESPWLFPASIRENILFGEPFIDAKYNHVLHICALAYDLQFLPKGDGTIVGDNGINLSKGQQARINLARAVYRDSDIYLLDNCLASLDVKVQDKIFADCIRGYLGNKLCLLVSNNYSFVKHADNFIILENGTIKSIMDPSDLLENKISRYIDDDEEKRKTLIMTQIEANENEDATEISQLMQTNSNLYREVNQSGKVAGATYHKYIKFSGGYTLGTLILLFYIAAQAAVTYNDSLVRTWVNIEEQISTLQKNESTNTTEYENVLTSRNTTLTYFTATLVVGTVLSIVRFIIHIIYFTRGSINVHKAMTTRIINARMEFFDTHLIGNILNRFSKDLATMDEYIPFIIYECARIALVMGGIVVLIVTVNKLFIVGIIILFVKVFFIRNYYLPAGRSLKRLDSATRSPLIGHLNATLEGLTVIRSYGKQEKVKDDFDKYQDLYMSAYHMYQIAMRAFGLLVDFVCNMFTIMIVVKFLIGDPGATAGDVGLAISQAFLMTGLLQWGIRQSAELENQMTSVERAIEYTHVNVEETTGTVVKDWPNLGTIIFDNVSLIYQGTKHTALHNISFEIGPKEKIGIVGRTGAGKSSIISSLFRLYDIQGSVYIDGMDTSDLSLDFLRSKISIIPQDPILFTGTIRNNIDPTNAYSDVDIWRAVDAVGLKPILTDLDDVISEGGANYSSGQRQLICLARAVIQKNRILVLDEATANIDPETATFIHDTIQKQFVSCTVLTVAHRLSSVVHSDRVMVIDRGHMIEFDKPSVLLADKTSTFHRMVQQSSLI